MLCLRRHGVVPFILLSARCLVQSMLACHSQRFFRPIGADLLLAALVRFETIDAGPSLEASFRMGRYWPVVGSVGLINCFHARW